MTNPSGQLRLLLPSGRETGTGPRYGSLLVILVVTYVLSAFTVANLVSAVQVVLFLAVVLIALRTDRFQRRTARIVAVGLLLGSVASVILLLVDDTGVPGGVANLWTALTLTLAVVFIVRQVLSAPQITEQSIYGVLSAYMMLGLIFAAVYFALWKFHGQAFFAQGDQKHPTSETFQYFSFTTLTTLGYGDFTAAYPDGRAVAVLEAMVGQVFLVTLVARLVAGFRWSDEAAARHARHRATPAGGAEVSDSDPDPALPAGGPAAPGAPRPAEAAPGPATSGPSSPRRPRATKAGAAGLVRLSPPGTVRGRGTGQRPGGRKGTGEPGPVPADRPDKRN